MLRKHKGVTKRSHLTLSAYVISNHIRNFINHGNIFITSRGIKFTMYFVLDGVTRGLPLAELVQANSLLANT